jgi:hypothetical protein
VSVVAKAVAAVVIGVIVGGVDGSTFVVVDEGSGTEGAREGNVVETDDVVTDGIDDVLVDKSGSPEEVVSNKVEEVVSVEVGQGGSGGIEEVVPGEGDEVRSGVIEVVASDEVEE